MEEAQASKHFHLSSNLLLNSPTPGLNSTDALFCHSQLVKTLSPPFAIFAKRGLSCREQRCQPAKVLAARQFQAVLYTSTPRPDTKPPPSYSLTDLPALAQKPVCKVLGGSSHWEAIFKSIYFPVYSIQIKTDSFNLWIFWLFPLLMMFKLVEVLVEWFNPKHNSYHIQTSPSSWDDIG